MFQKMRIKNLRGLSGVRFEKNSTPSPWKRGKNTSSATFVPNESSGLLHNNKKTCHLLSFLSYTNAIFMFRSEKSRVLFNGLQKEGQLSSDFVSRSVFRQSARV